MLFFVIKRHVYYAFFPTDDGLFHQESNFPNTQNDFVTVVERNIHNKQLKIMYLIEQSTVCPLNKYKQVSKMCEKYFFDTMRCLKCFKKYQMSETWDFPQFIIQNEMIQRSLSPIYLYDLKLTSFSSVLSSQHGLIYFLNKCNPL